MKNIKLYLIAIGVALITSLGYGVNHYRTKAIQLDQSLGTYKSNLLALQDQYNTVTTNARVLEITVDELIQSNDSLMQHLVDYKRALKVKDNEIKSAILVGTQQRDTFITTVLRDTMNLVPATLCDFTVEVIPNELTYFKVISKNDSITLIDNIKDELLLITTEHKVYRNPNKSFFKRLFTWDWQKDLVIDYNIENKNKRISITDIRCISIIK